MLRSALAALVVVFLAAPSLAEGPRPGKVGTEARAQKTKEAKEAKVRRYLALVGAEQQGRALLEARTAELNRTRPLPPGFTEKLQNLTDQEPFLPLLVPLWAERLSERDLDAAIAFYESPAGRALVQLQPALQGETTRLAEEWASRLARKALEQVPTTPLPQQVLEEPTYRVPLDGRPARGPATAKVTLVEFVDYQCPFCARANGTLKELKEIYGASLRLVSRQNPLPFHKDALAAAKAALAAHEQGQYWPMHDRLYGGQRELGPEALEGHAAQLGLDLVRFREAMASERVRTTIEADQALARQLGALGTPTFYANGRVIKGAQPLAKFKEVIDAELVQADAALARGVRLADLYEELTRGGLLQAPPKPAPSPKPADAERLPMDVPAWSPVAGPANARVTLVLFTDLQCPFCARVDRTVAQILEAYPRDVRLVFRHLPLGFHKEARPAAIASMAAHRQGRFFEFVRKVFASQKDLAPGIYEGFAQDLGLDLARFRRDLQDPEVAAQVDADAKSAGSLGVTGTPTFLLNGQRVVGAQPFEAFKAKVDAELGR